MELQERFPEHSSDTCTFRIPGVTKEFSIRDIEDLEMRYKVIQMRKSQPYRLYQISKTALEQVHGDFDEASALLLSR